MKKILVYGAGITGQAIIEYLESNKIEYDVFSPKFKFKNNYAYAIVSAGIPLFNKGVKSILKHNIKIIGELEFAKNIIKGKTVAITGTNGKTTTTNLIYHFLNFAKLDAHIGGNLGIPIIEMAKNTSKNSINCIEVSSYMLEKSPNFKPNIAVLLNLTPDHIEHHQTLENYYQTKINMFNNLTSNDFAILNLDDKNVVDLTNNINCKKVYFSICNTNADCYIEDNFVVFNGEKVCAILNFQLLGEHNLYNLCASVCVAKILNVGVKLIDESLNYFMPLKHRLNTVLSKNGKLFLNDSKATNIASMLCALKSINGKKVLILGGLGKGEDFKEVFKLNNYKIQNIVCYGNEGKRIEKQISKSFNKKNIFRVYSFESAVNLACKITKRGEKCLLSPACASFDQHKNFEERGNEFERIVKKCNE